MSVDINKIRKGDKLVLAYPHNGYDYHKEAALKIIEKYGPNPVFTLKSKDIGSWSTSLQFEEIDGHWNSVQFAKYPVLKWKVIKTETKQYESTVYAGTNFDAQIAARYVDDEKYFPLTPTSKDSFEAFRIKSEVEEAAEELQHKKTELVDRVLDVLMDEVESREAHYDDLLQMTRDELIRLLFEKRVNS